MQNLKLLGVPFDYGQKHSGVRLAYSKLKEDGLLERLGSFVDVHDLGELNFPRKLSENHYHFIRHKDQSSLGNKFISDFISNEDLRDSFLLNIGGDHGMALGTIHGLLSHHPNAVVVWADAHGDINTPETSPSGNFHGMPLSFLLSLTKDPDFGWIRHHLLPKKLIYMGPRDLDQGEKDLIEKYGIQYYSSEEINRVGVSELLPMALNKADPHGIHPIHLSFDVDVFDQFDISATGTKVPLGPKLEEMFLLGGLLAETGRLVSMDLVEFNPEIGTSEEVANSSALISEFLESTVKQVFMTRIIPKIEAIPASFFTKGHFE